MLSQGFHFGFIDTLFQNVPSLHIMGHHFPKYLKTSIDNFKTIEFSQILRQRLDSHLESEHETSENESAIEELMENTSGHEKENESSEEEEYKSR